MRFMHCLHRGGRVQAPYVGHAGEARTGRLPKGGDKMTTTFTRRTLGAVLTSLALTGAERPPRKLHFFQMILQVFQFHMH